ncbi:hypothetical protein U1Q18_018409 [Sarracenia purpurea var. burkii]
MATVEISSSIKGVGEGKKGRGGDSWPWVCKFDLFFSVGFRSLAAASGGERMRNPGENNEEKLIIVAIDDDKRSKMALKWAVDHVLTRGQTVRVVPEEMEENMRMLKLQMKQTMDMYNVACREALTAKQKVKELQILRVEDKKRIEETKREKAVALMAAAKERENCEVAIKMLEATRGRAK